MSKMLFFLLGTLFGVAIVFLFVPPRFLITKRVKDQMIQEAKGYIDTHYHEAFLNSLTDEEKECLKAKNLMSSYSPQSTSLKS